MSIHWILFVLELYTMYFTYSPSRLCTAAHTIPKFGIFYPHRLNKQTCTADIKALHKWKGVTRLRTNRKCCNLMYVMIVLHGMPCVSLRAMFGVLKVYRQRESAPFWQKIRPVQTRERHYKAQATGL